MPIKTESHYDAALAEIDQLMDAKPNTPRGDKLEVLATLVEAYETKHWAIDPPDPVDAIKLRMKERSLTRRDLEQILGGSGRVSEVLNRKRALSVAMMRRLHVGLDIPAASLLTPAVPVSAKQRSMRRPRASAKPSAGTLSRHAKAATKRRIARRRTA